MQIISFLRRALLGLSLCAVLSVQAAERLTEILGAAESHVKPGETPQGLKAAEWTSIQKQIEHSRYRLEPTEAGVSGANPRQS